MGDNAVATVDTEVLCVIDELAEQRADVDEAIVDVARPARAARSRSEIGAMLGASKRAAHRRCAELVSA